MKQELGPNQTKWLAALRSGEYKQCVGRLQRDNGYCCLGVATCVLDPQSAPLSGLNLKLYPRVRQGLALYGSNGDPYDTISFPGLTSLNDHLGKSFTEIADIIESDPSVYFNEPR